MENKIQVTILDDHPLTINGYVASLNSHPQIEVAATINYGEDLEPTLVKTPTDVLILDINVPNSAEDENYYPIMHVIPKLLEIYTDLVILVISMHAKRGLICAAMESGASGYILKDDQSTARDLGGVILAVAKGGRYMSEKAHLIYKKCLQQQENQVLSPRQTEVLSLCGAYPNKSVAEIAKMLSIENSTVRNTLSAIYAKFEVNSRAAAIAKGQQLGLIATAPPSP